MSDTKDKVEPHIYYDFLLFKHNMNKTLYNWIGERLAQPFCNKIEGL